MKNRYLTASVFLALASLCVSTTFANDYVCLDSRGLKQYAMTLTPGQPNGTVKILDQDQKDVKDYPFDTEAPFDLGRSQNCEKWTCNGLCVPLLQDWYETGRYVCSKRSTSTYSGLVPKSEDTLKQTLKVDVTTTIPRTLLADKVVKSSISTTCFRDHAIKFYDSYSAQAIAGNGQGLFLERESNSSTEDLLKTKVDILNYHTLERTKSTIESIANAIDSGEIKLVTMKSYTENFDIRKVKSAVCWKSGGKLPLLVEADKLTLQYSREPSTGTILVVENKVKVLFAENTVEEAKLVQDGVFTFMNSLCFATK